MDGEGARASVAAMVGGGGRFEIGGNPNLLKKNEGREGTTYTRCCIFCFILEKDSILGVTVKYQFSKLLHFFSVIFLWRCALSIGNGDQSPKQRLWLGSSERDETDGGDTATREPSTRYIAPKF